MELDKIPNESIGQSVNWFGKWKELVVFIIYCSCRILAWFGVPGFSMFSFLILSCSIFLYSIYLLKILIVDSWEDNKAKKYSVFCVVAVCVTLTGSLFKDMFWDYATFIIVTGYSLLFLAGNYTFKQIKNRQNISYNKKMLVRIVLVGMIGLFWENVPKSLQIKEYQETIRRENKPNTIDNQMTDSEKHVSDSLMNQYHCNFYFRKITGEFSSNSPYIIVELDSCENITKDSLEIYASRMSYSYRRVVNEKKVQIVFTRYNPTIGLTDDEVYTFSK